MTIRLPSGRDESVVAQAIDYAAAFHQRGMLAEAEKFYAAVLKVRPDHFHALHQLAVLRRQQGDDTEAVRLIHAALKTNPRSVVALCNFGATLDALHHEEEALRAYDDVLAIDPGHLEALIRRGHLLARLGRAEEALETYRTVLDTAPKYVSTLMNNGNALLALGRMGEAIAAFETAAAVAAEQLAVLDHRAAALRALGRDEAQDRRDGPRPGICYEADAHYHRGVALWALEKHRDAIESYEKAYAAGHPGALSMLAYCRLSLADWAQADELTNELRRSMSKGAFADAFLSLALGFQPLDQMQAARSSLQHLMPPVPEKFHHPIGVDTDKLRIAYLSADFRQHPVGLAVAELFERHDRAHFEVIGVSIGLGDESSTRTRIVKSLDRFHDVATDTDWDIAKLLNDLEVHIAVDLNGLSGGCRPAILACRPAPIQVSYLGYAATTAADFIDYILADATVLPFDQQPFFSEKIVQLPDCFFTNDTTRRISPETPSRSELALPAHGFVFCCFNKSYKIIPPIFDVWMRLLARVPDSVLWLSEMTTPGRDNLRREAAARGVDPERLIFAPRMGRIDDHLARHRAADLFLDTLPYNAHATANDALFVGLPVITCTGEAFASRVGASMLKAAGSPELVTHSLEDYEAVAYRLATDRPLLEAIRGKLAEHRSSCPLFDTDRLRRHIEAAYVTMWEIYRRGESPRGFAVEPYAATSGALR
jgi:protein O-GlcNAc transferase